MQIDIAAVETTAGVELSGPPLRAGSWLRRLDAGLVVRQAEAFEADAAE